MSSVFTTLELFLGLFTIGITLRLGARFADSGITNIKQMFKDIKETICKHSAPKN